MLGILFNICLKYVIYLYLNTDAIKNICIVIVLRFLHLLRTERVIMSRSKNIYFY